MSGTSPAAAAARTTVDLVVLRAATWRVELTREHPSLEDVDKAKAMFISCVTDAFNRRRIFRAAQSVVARVASRATPSPTSSIDRATNAIHHTLQTQGSHVPGCDLSTTHPLRCERFLDDENNHHDDTYMGMCMPSSRIQFPRTTKIQPNENHATERREARLRRREARREGHCGRHTSPRATRKATRWRWRRCDRE
jgi:hypothetical protein